MFPLFSVFLAFQSYSLVSAILQASPTDFGWSASFGLAFIVNLYVTGIFAFPGFVFPTHRIIAKQYYAIEKPQRLERLYKLLQVDVFKKFLLLFFWGHKKNRKKYFDGSRSGLSNLTYQSKQSEFGHLIPFVLVLGLCIAFFLLGFWKLATWTMLINILGNFYPVVLQRQHRIRIDRILRTHEA